MSESKLITAKANPLIPHSPLIHTFYLLLNTYY